MNKNFEFPIVAVNQGEYMTVQKWILDNQARLTEKRIFIYGAGIRGNLFYRILQKNNIKVSGFIDGSEEKQGAKVGDVPIVALENIGDKENCFVLVSPENNKEIVSLLEKNEYKRYQDYDVIDSIVYSEYFEEYIRKGDIEYIFFGDCFFPDVDVNDLDQKSMGEMVKEQLGVEKTKVLTLHGMCTPSFYYILREQLTMGIRPKAVSFIVNVPFCGGIQTKLPQSQHPIMMERLLEVHGDEEFAEYVALAKKRATNINQKSFFTNASGKDPNTVEKMLTKMRYMYPYNASNENIVYAIKIIELLNQYQIKAKPFIPALHYKAGVDFWGDEFTVAYDAICQGIRNTMNEYDVEILDMSYLLDESMFFGDHMTKFPNREGKEKEVNTLVAYVTEE